MRASSDVASFRVTRGRISEGRRAWSRRSLRRRGIWRSRPCGGSPCRPRRSGLADDAGRDLGLAQAFQLAHDAADQQLDLIGLDRAFAQGDAQRAFQLVAVEGGAAAVPFQDDQFAQLHPLEGGEAPVALRAGPTAADGRAVVRRAAVLDLGVGVSTEGALHPVGPLAVDREACGQLAHLGGDARNDGRIGFVAAVHRRDDVGDPVADLLELCLAEAARGAGRGAQTDARGDGEGRGVERHAVLVAGHQRLLELMLGGLAGHALGTQVDQHQVVVGAARDDVEAALDEHAGHGLGVLHHLLLVGLELRLQRFLEGHGLGGDDVLQRAALQAGEDGRVDLLRDVGVVGQDHAAAWTAQGLVGGGGDDVGVRHRVGPKRRPGSAWASPSGPFQRRGHSRSDGCLPTPCRSRGGTTCPTGSRASRGSGGRRGPGPCPGRCRRAAAGRSTRPGWPGSRSAAARWRSRRRTAAWRGRWPVARPRRRIRSHRSSACPGSLRRTCWSVPSLELPSPQGWCSFPKRSARCALPGGQARPGCP
uniref:PE-PGRS family protein n=1 Tax=Parastrongyloides trichosuri TaxID=131310 RepID=A0A0N4ZIZ9_PARTI